MGIACELTISFASVGNSLAYLGGGWAQSEDDFTWGIGSESHLVFPRVEAADEYILTLDVIPFIHPPHLSSQRLIVSVNDAVVGSAELSRPTLLAYRIPASLSRRSECMLVTLQHSDAARRRDLGNSSDDRPLAFALKEARLYRVAGTESSTGNRLPQGLMLPALAGRSVADRAFQDGKHADLAEWVLNRTGLTIPQIALKFESLGKTASSACSSAVATPNRWGFCASPARSCAT